jgi:hydantoinase/carbamoylase family amidase
MASDALSGEQTDTASVSAAHASAMFGPRIMALINLLARWSETRDGLTCTYLSQAHRAVAGEIREIMATAGMQVSTDAVGNVIGRYAADDPNARTLIVGSHYDTVRNAGKYDGRLGIVVPLVLVERLQRTGRRLPYHLDVIAFSEEEGVRFSTGYIGSAAVAGRFDVDMLKRVDAEGHTMVGAMREAGLDPTAIPVAARRREDLLGYLEVHIEQGPVLLEEGLPVGIVSSIAGNVRLAVTVEGVAGHAGTVPMAMRHDAAAAAADVVLAVERRCAFVPGLVGTVGQLTVPDGAINVIPGRCDLSIDIRAGDDHTRDAAVIDVIAEMEHIANRRGVTITRSDLMRAPAVSCATRFQRLLADAIERIGYPVRHLSSGAGHDAVMFDGLTDIGMLFVRCGNGGVSHSPRETITAEDADVAAHVLLDVLLHVKSGHGAR